MAASTALWTRQGSESDSDVWDDRLLIEEWERSSRMVASAQNESDQNNHSDVSSLSNGQSGRKKKKQNKDGKPSQWKVGHFCRCTYSEDGLEYEAQVIKLLPAGRCRVRYFGYNNEEEQIVGQLKPSLGADARAKQKSESEQPEQLGEQPGLSEHDIVTNQEEEIAGEVAEESVPVIATENGKEEVSRKRTIMPPPPSWFPQGLMSNDDDECLASMLMSWYMSGYHTGYYKAMKQFKKPCNCQQGASTSTDQS